MTLDTSKAALFIEHSERARQLGHKARFCSRYNEGSLRLFTRQRALTPTSGGNPPRRRCHRAFALCPVPSRPLGTPPNSGNLIRGLSAILPHPSRSMLVKGGRAFALAPSAICVRRRFPPPSSPSSLSEAPLSAFLDTNPSISLSLSPSNPYPSVSSPLHSPVSRLTRVRERR